MAEEIIRSVDNGQFNDSAEAVQLGVD